MQLVDDLMTADPVCLDSTNNLFQGRCIMRDHNIRHVPVVDADSGNFYGVLTQKIVLAHAINIIDTQGIEALDTVEKMTSVNSVVDQETVTVSRSTPLLEAAKFFTENRHGCIVVVEQNKVVGILTSGDIVRFAISVLEQS